MKISDKALQALIAMAFIKAQKFKNERALAKATTTKQKEKLWDDSREMYRNFSDLLEENFSEISLIIERMTDKNKNYFCVMAPVGGPWAIRKEASLHIYKLRGGTIDVVFDSYIGHINLWNDPCGMDNLKILLNGKSDAE